MVRDRDGDGTPGAREDSSIRSSSSPRHMASGALTWPLAVHGFSSVAHANTATASLGLHRCRIISIFFSGDLLATVCKACCPRPSGEKKKNNLALPWPRIQMNYCFSWQRYKVAHLSATSLLSCELTVTDEDETRETKIKEVSGLSMTSLILVGGGGAQLHNTRNRSYERVIRTCIKLQTCFL